MIKYAVDWAMKKDFAITKDGKEVKFIPANIESFDKFFNSLNGEKCQFYLEEGGGDSFKLLANRNGHEVFTTIGKNTDNRREELGIEKTDENDAKIIIFGMAKYNPELFRKFAEQDIATAKVRMRLKSKEDAEENLIRAKNRLYALKITSELLDVGKNKKKMIKQKEKVIEELDKDFQLEKKELGKLVEKLPIWINYLKGIKGVGAVCAGGLIAHIRVASRFPNRYHLRSYMGMIPREDDHPHNKKKRTLFFFTEGIIKARTPKWRELYDGMKIDYAEKHPDWSKGRVHNYAKKRVQTKFLDELYKKMIEVEKDLK